MVDDSPNWYLRHWLEATRTRQVDLIGRTEWTKSKVSKLVNDKQDYDRETLNVVADALNIEPYELLMHPADAMRIRSMFQAMGDPDSRLRVAAERKTPYAAEPGRK